MNGEFVNHKEIKWEVSVTGGFYSGAEGLQTVPNLNNFKLKEIIELEETKNSNENTPRLKLVGEDGKTIVYLYCAKEILKRFQSELGKYLGKAWLEIANLRI